MSPRSLLFALPFCLITACTTTTTTSHQVIHGERDGVPLIRTVGAPLHDGPVFELIPDLVLGIDEGEPEWQIFGSMQALYAPDGRIVIGDGRRYELFILSREGELLHRLGGPGSGPGELRNLMLMHWVDTGREFWTEDQNNGRINRYSMDGEYLGQLSRAPLVIKNIFIQPLSRDRFLASYGEWTGNESRSVYGFLNSELAWVHDFMTVRSSPSFPITATGYLPTPFTRGDGCRATTDGRVLVSRPNEGQIALYSAAGELVRYIEREWEFAPVAHEDKEAIRKRFRESSNQQWRAVADDIPFPDRYPAFSGVYMDDGGRIWVQHYPKGSYMRHEGPVTYDIFDSDGVWIATQEFEFGFTVCGDYAYRQYYAESGGPRLERYILRSLNRK